jgi:fucose 4-O-acetylase-like acetyltransferase
MPDQPNGTTLRHASRTDGRSGYYPVLDILRGLAVVLVVVDHSVSFGHVAAPASYGPVNSALTAFRMPALFIISGYLSQTGAFSRFSYAKKIMNLAWLCLLWLPILLLVKLCFGLDTAIVLHPAMLVSEYVEPSTHGWFIWALLLYMLTLPMIGKSAPKYILPITAIVATIGFNDTLGLYFSQNNILKYYFFFVLGVLGRGVITQLLERRIRKRTIAAAVAAGAILFAVDHSLQGHGEWRIFGAVIRIVACLVFLGIVQHVRSPKFDHALGWLGKRTVPIYLLHVLFIYLMSHYISSVLTGVSNAAIPFAIAASAATASVLISKSLSSIGLEWLFMVPGSVVRFAQRASRSPMAASVRKAVRP